MLEFSGVASSESKAATTTQAQRKMGATTRDQVQHIFEEWHAAIMDHDIERLMELYTEDAVLESPLIMVYYREESGRLNGRERMKQHFLAFFKHAEDKRGSDWYRADTYFWDNNTVSWEYQGKNLKGEEQLDVVESCDLVDGKISVHRVLWGVNGYKYLAKMDKERSEVIF
jgi:steroid delta-isomerase